MSIENQPETKLESFTPKELRVFRMRHGHTDYREHAGRGEEAIDEDLNEEGIVAVRKSAQHIINKINPDEDLVFVVSSPRARARHTANIVEEELKKANIEVQDPGDRKLQQRIIGSELMKDGEVVPANTEEHSDIWYFIQGEALAADPETIKQVRKRYLEGQISEIEPQDSVRKRARNQLTYLCRLAKKIQSKVDKRIVIIQTEHEETLSELVEEATGGERSMFKDTGPEKAEVFQLDIPTTGEEPITISSLNNPDKTQGSINFDPVSRNFKVDTE